LGPIVLKSPTSFILIAFAGTYLLFIGFPLIYAGRLHNAEHAPPAGRGEAPRP
jgi:hypothetical protein